MTYYFTDNEGSLHKLDTDASELLMKTREHRARWSELYRTRGGTLVLVHATRWQGERDSVHVISLAEAVRELALCDPSERTEAGDAFLQQNESQFVREV